MVVSDGAITRFLARLTASKRRVVLRELRKLERQGRRADRSAKLEVPIDSLIEEPAATPDFFTALASAESFCRILDRLHQRDREIVELAVLHRMTAPEIARSTGLTVDAVNSIKKRSIEALRRSVPPDK